ncbi:MAG: isocitrate dehydrogenase kinase/phosphatase-domain containing protein, partial [Burkholderiaceae bacterium]
IKDMAAANIFPGDMLYKNFGVTRLNRVVFYDYDEIEYMTDCEFRRMPQARHYDEEISDEAWFAVDARDMFPEKWGAFLLGDPRIRAAFARHHADLLTPDFWNARKQRIQAGQLENVFPYSPDLRFNARFAKPRAAESGLGSPSQLTKAMQ